MGPKPSIFPSISIVVLLEVIKQLIATTPSSTLDPHLLSDLTQYPADPKTSSTGCHAWHHVDLLSLPTFISVTLMPSRSSVKWTWAVLRLRDQSHINLNTTAQGSLSSSVKLALRIEHLRHIAHPHLLVRATSEPFLLVRATFKNVLANESHWLQQVLVRTVLLVACTNKCGWANSPGGSGVK